MKKKKLKVTPGLITATIVCIGSLGGVIIWVATMLSLPNRVEAVEAQTEDIKDWIKEQQYINKYYFEKEQKPKSPIISRDGKWFWDEELKKWRPIKHLR